MYKAIVIASTHIHSGHYIFISSDVSIHTLHTSICCKDFLKEFLFHQLMATVFRVDAEPHPIFITNCEININRADYHSHEAKLSVTAPTCEVC